VLVVEKRRRLRERSAVEMASRLRGSGISGDVSAALHDEIDRLPNHYRAPIVLCDLQGRTYEDAARSLGCPVGTLKSRLARGRDRLRERLVDRGLTLSGRGVAPVFAIETKGADVAAPLMEATVQLAMRFTVGQRATGAVSAAVELAESTLRGMVMVKLKTIAAVVLVTSSLAFTLAWAVQPASRAEPPSQAESVKRADDRRAQADDPFQDKERHDNFARATIGNIMPYINNRPQSREAILYIDGTVKVWTFDSHPPVGEPLRHADPIRDLTFYNAAKVLVTSSSQTTKLWDALTAKPRGEIEAAYNPLLYQTYSPKMNRFITLDRGLKSVTLLDAANFVAIRTFPTGEAPVVATALSGNGQTFLTFGEDRAIGLWDVPEGVRYANLRSPSPVTDIIAADGRSLDNAKLGRLDAILRVVDALAPTARGRDE
jgi:hypothetical protein